MAHIIIIKIETPKNIMVERISLPSPSYVKSIITFIKFIEIPLKPIPIDIAPKYLGSKILAKLYTPLITILYRKPVRISEIKQ
jgi:hypothetical protein